MITIQHTDNCVPEDFTHTLWRASLQIHTANVFSNIQKFMKEKHMKEITLEGFDISSDKLYFIFHVYNRFMPWHKGCLTMMYEDISYKSCLTVLID
jgi:hypothetical protein